MTRRHLADRRLLDPRIDREHLASVPQPFGRLVSLTFGSRCTCRPHHRPAPPGHAQTGTTTTRSSRPAKSSGLRVTRGRLSATATAAISRSANLLRGWRPAATTAA